MITLDVIETLENASGLLVGFELPERLYVGLVPAETATNEVPLGLSILGSLGPHQKYPVHTCTKTRVEKLKGNQTKYLKELKLIQEPNQEVKIVGGPAANAMIAHAVCLASSYNPHLHKLIGYRHKSKVYLADKLPELFADLHANIKAFLSGTKETRESSKLLLQPLQLDVELLCSLKEPQANTIQNTEPSKDPAKVYSFMVVEDLSEPSPTDIKRFDQHMRAHTELVLQAGREPVKQALPQFLKKLPTVPPIRMLNIHQYLPIEQLWQHTRFFCKGRYHFHHYLEDQFNDKGWGCAYRACQTVLSWFNEQQYCSLAIPTIRDMQKTLFEIDRSRNLVNTSEWIGANEVGWLLTKLCGVECKIVHLSDGQNIMEKVEQLRHHLQTSGSPIMFGGDNYAFTIVGLNYSWETGECQFLIVDPHYIDENTIKQVVSKEGVYWRDRSKLFKKGCYYNFCLPQVPQ